MTRPSVELSHDAAPAVRSAPRLAVGFRAVGVLALAAVCVAVAVTVFTPRGTSRSVAAAPTSAVTAAPADGDALFVHVTGAVSHPGLYEVSDGARVLDVIAAAGGFAPEAERDGVNLARKVSDGEQVHVPAIGEVIVPDTPGQAAPPGGKVNLNTASEAELETLPRVGPATAARIVKWRESNGPFRSVDELLEVTGIGEKTLDGFRDAVTV